MAPIDNNKWDVLRELALAYFLEDAEVANAMRRAEELADQQPADAAAFVAAMEAVVQAEEEKRVSEVLLVINRRARSIVGSWQAEGEAWALVAAVAAHQEKEVMEVAEDATRQAVALLQSQSVDIATFESTRPVLSWGRTTPSQPHGLGRRHGHGRGQRGWHGRASGATRRGGQCGRRHRGPLR
jgi:hypothetical protein